MKQETIDVIGRYGLIVLTITTLLALLTYTFVHTGGLLSEYVEPYQVGYVAAFGIEAAIITMSIRLGKLLRQLAHDGYQGKETWLSFAWQGVTLLFVLTVSAIANIVEGHKVKHGAELTLTTIQALDGLQIIIGLVATGVIPVVVLAMTEIVSGEVKAMMERGEASLQVIGDESTIIEGVIANPVPEVRFEPALPPVLQNLIADLQPQATLTKEGLQEVELTEEARPEDQDEPTLDPMLSHFKKSRQELIAMLKQYDLWNAKPENVYRKVKLFVGLPDSITSDVFAKLLAELKAGEDVNLQKSVNARDDVRRAWQLADEGKSQSEIANELGKSVATVSRHLAKRKGAVTT